jgi:hypothetical protein
LYVPIQARQQGSACSQSIFGTQLTVHLLALQRTIAYALLNTPKENPKNCHTASPASQAVPALCTVSANRAHHTSRTPGKLRMLLLLLLLLLLLNRHPHLTISVSTGRVKIRATPTSLTTIRHCGECGAAVLSAKSYPCQ